MNLFIIALIIVYILLSIFYTARASDNTHPFNSNITFSDLITGMIAGGCIEIFGLSILYIIKYMFT